MRPRWRERVRMHLKDGPSVEGVLVDVRAGHYRLQDVALVMAAGAEPVKLDSPWLEVPVSNVAFFERKSL